VQDIGFYICSLQIRRESSEKWQSQDIFNISSLCIRYTTPCKIDWLRVIGGNGYMQVTEIRVLLNKQKRNKQ
jgi:hypothetical protein